MIHSSVNACLSIVYANLLAWATVGNPVLPQEVAVYEDSQRLLQLPKSDPPHSANVMAIDFSSDARWIAVSGPDGKVRVLAGDSKSETPVVAVLDTKDLSRKIPSLAFAPNGKQVAIATLNQVFLATIDSIDQSNFEDSPAIQLSALTGSNRVAYSPDGTLLAVGGYQEPAQLMDVASGEVRFRWDPFAGVGLVDTGLYKSTTQALDFSPDGKRLAVTTGFFDDELPSFENVQVWEVATGKLSFFFRGGHAEFSPDGQYLAYRNVYYEGSDNLDGRIVVMDLDTFLPAGAMTGRYERYRFSPRVGELAATTDVGLELWKFDPTNERSSQPNCKRVAIFKHNQKITCFDFSPDGKSIVTVDQQGEVRRWPISK